jgi:hypothetical protein
MSRSRLLSILVSLAVVAGGCQRPAMAPQSFAWTGNIPAGSWLRIRNLNGKVAVVPSSASQVEVTATVHGHPRANQLRFEENSFGSNVVICTMYSPGGSCTESDYSTRAGGHWWAFWRHRGNVNVEYTVHLPAGVKIDASTINGRVEVAGAGAEVIAQTVNGSIDVATSSGPVRATTVNGSVIARVDSLTSPGDVRIETVNGSVTAELPESLNAQLEMETVNGRVSTDFPITLTGKVDPHHLRATLGTGGRTVKLETVNGSVTVRRRA